MAKTELEEKLKERWKIFEDTMWEVALANDFRPNFTQMLNFLKAVRVIEDEWIELLEHRQNLDNIRQGDYEGLTQGKVDSFVSLADKLKEKWQAFLLPDDKD